LFSAVVLRTTGPFSAPPFGGGRPAHLSGFPQFTGAKRRREPTRRAAAGPRTL